MNTFYMYMSGFWEIICLEVKCYYNKNCVIIYQVFNYFWFKHDRC